MQNHARKPFFCVVLSQDQQWVVDAEWPDGTIEQIAAFDGHLDAMSWLSNRSDTWLQERHQLLS
jgi:hypothetical protein